MAECFLPTCKKTGKFLLHKNLDGKWQILNEHTVQTKSVLRQPMTKFRQFMDLTGLTGDQWNVTYPGGYTVYSISIVWVDTTNFDPSAIEYELGWFQLFSEDAIDYDRATGEALESGGLYHVLTSYIDT